MGKRISQLAIALGLDSEGFDAGLKKAKASSGKFANDVKKDGESLEGFGSKIGGGMLAGLAAVGLSVAGIVAGLHQAFEKVSEVDKMARQLQIKPETFQQVNYLAEQTGAESEELIKIFGKLPSILADARDASTPLGATFKRLGLDAEKLQGMGTAQAFSEIIKSLEGVQNAGERAYLATNLFGERARKIMPLIGEDIQGVIDEANGLGIVLSGEQVASVKIMGDEWARFSAQVSAIFQKLVVEFAPVVTAMLKYIGSIIKELGGVDGIVSSIKIGFVALSDVMSDVWNIAKVTVGVFAIQALEDIGTILTAVESLASALGEVGNEFIDLASDAKKLFGGSSIDFKFGKLEIGAESVKDFTAAMRSEVEDSVKKIGSGGVSHAISDIDDAHQREAKDIDDRLNKSIALNGAFDAVTKSANGASSALKAIETKFGATSTVEDVAKGKGANADIAKRALSERDRADKLEAEGRYDEADKVRAHAEELASKVNRRFKGIDPKTGQEIEFDRQGRSVGDLQEIDGTTSTGDRFGTGRFRRTGEAGGFRKEMIYDYNPNTVDSSTSADAKRPSGLTTPADNTTIGAQRDYLRLIYEKLDALGVN